MEPKLVLASVKINKYNKCEVLHWFSDGTNKVVGTYYELKYAMQQAHKNDVPVVLGQGIKIENLADLLSYNIDKWLED